MKILYMTESNKFFSGGVRQLMYNMRGMKELGMDITLVCRKEADIAEMAKPYANIKFADFTSVFRAGEDIKKVILDFQPDVIHTFHNKGHKAGVIAKIKSGTKAKLFVNRGVVSPPGNLLYYLNPWVNGFICNSKECMDVLASRLVKRSKLHLIHNGIDTELFGVKEKNESPKTVYIGNVGPLKGFDLYEKAVNGVSSDVDFKALALGLIEQFENGRIVSVGKHRNVQDFMNFGDIFVLSSRAKFESFPNVLIESMACGLATVCFDVGAVPDIMKDGVNGFIIPRENTALMAEKIEYLLRNPEICREMGKKNRQDVVRRFSYKVKCEKLLKLYRGEPFDTEW